MRDYEHEQHNGPAGHCLEAREGRRMGSLLSLRRRDRAERYLARYNSESIVRGIERLRLGSDSKITD